jgi:predicted dehydrogenase
MKTKQLRIGVMGCGNIARQFVAAVATSPHVKVAAAASRDRAKSAEFAKTFGLPKHYGSYEALLQDTSLDIIYVALPNSMHVEWVVKAAQSGKHVLSEKPLALTLDEAQAMFAAARQAGVMLLEAYPYWFQPQTRDMLELIQGGAIGEVRHVQASFGFNLQNSQGNIRMNPDLGGGALLDAGSYAMSLIRLAIPARPIHVSAQSHMAESGVDIGTSATLWYEGGRSAQLHCAMNVGYHRMATLVGSHGVIETEFLNHTGSPQAGSASPQPNQLPSMMRVRKGFGNAIPFVDVQSASGSGFAFCAEAFAKVIHEKDFAAIERAEAASCDIAAALAAIGKSARESVMGKFARFSPDFMAEGRGDQTQAERDTL